MKRAFPQEPVSNLVLPSLDGTVEQSDQGFLGNRRSVRTSAAMLGLALSMGASGTLLPRGGAVAAGLPSATLNPTLSTVPSGLDVPVAGMMPVATASSDAVYHTVQEGQTLSQIAAVHSVDVDVVEQANGVSAETLLQVGQVLRIPVSVQATAAEAAIAPETSELAAAAQEQVAFAQADAQLKAAQDDSLAAVHQKRQELQQALTFSSGHSLSPEAAASEIQPIDLQAANSITDPQTLSRVVPSEAAVNVLDEDSLALESLPGDVESQALVPGNWTSEAVPAQVATELRTPQSADVQLNDQPEFGFDAESASALPALTDGQSEPLAGANEEAIQGNIPQLSTRLESAAPTPWVEQQHEIRDGDTVADIAAAYGISTTDLVQINSLDDPDLIVAGDSLLIPSENRRSDLLGSVGANSVAAVDGAVFAAGADAPEPGDRLAYLQATVLNPIEDDSALQQLRQAMLPAQHGNLSNLDGASEGQVAIQASPEVVASATPTDDSYMANLMAEVAAAQQFDDELDSTASGVDLAASAEDLSSSALENPVETLPEAVNREFAARAVSSDLSSESPLGGATVVEELPQLLAAAPLGSEAYAPINRPAAGQLVSPDLPALPDADEFLPEVPNYFNGYIWPTTGTLTSGYGPRWGRMHHGVDIAGPVGTPIVAAASGVIERSGWNSGGYGNLVDIRHADGSMTRYAHNSRLLVRPGQQVAQGQQIAEMGSTGYSTGPHLHFEVHLPNHGTVNPMAHLPGR